MKRRPIGGRWVGGSCCSRGDLAKGRAEFLGRGLSFDGSITGMHGVRDAMHQVRRADGQTRSRVAGRLCECLRQDGSVSFEDSLDQRVTLGVSGCLHPANRRIRGPVGCLPLISVMAWSRPRRERSNMRPTEILREEHDHILRACAILDAMARCLQRGVEVAHDEATLVVDFVRFYADGLHHAKEEDVLFPALEDAGMPRGGGPIAVMLHEHTRGREFVRAMLDALPSLGQEAGRLRFANAARGFASLLEQHIAKENQVLFCMAERVLPASSEPGILERYAAREAAASASCGDKAAWENKLAILARAWI
jgi:hemerythrin-like domain-containing protein